MLACIHGPVHNKGYLPNRPSTPGLVEFSSEPAVVYDSEPTIGYTHVRPAGPTTGSLARLDLQHIRSDDEIKVWDGIS